MQEGFNFRFKVKVSGYSYDYDKNDYYDNGFIKVFYAKDFDELTQVVADFINGENRFIKTRFNSNTHTMEYTKFYANKDEISEELSYGIESDILNISDKTFFVLTSDGKIYSWDRGAHQKLFTLLEEINEDNVEYVVTIRLVVNKEEKNND